MLVAQLGAAATSLLYAVAIAVAASHSMSAAANSATTLVLTQVNNLNNKATAVLTVAIKRIKHNNSSHRSAHYRRSGQLRKLLHAGSVACRVQMHHFCTAHIILVPDM